MNLTVPEEAERRIRDISAQLGVKPRTAALAALRKGAASLTFEDVESDMSPEEVKRRAARDILKEIG